MIEILTATKCQGCQALKIALQHHQIPYQETDINSLGPEELGELMNIALERIWQSGADTSIQDYMSVPMVRANDRVLFAPDLLAGGCVTVEAIEKIRRLS